MKFLIYILLFGVPFNLLAMKAEIKIKDSQEEAQLVTLLCELTRYEQSCNELCKKADTVAASIDHMTAGVLYEILTERDKLRQSINKTRESISVTSLNAKFAENTIETCYSLAHKLTNNISFVIIETKYTALTTPTSQRIDRLPFPNMKLVSEELQTRQRHCQSAKLLSITKKFADLAVYQVETEELEELCCVYNALYNACNMEDWCGMPNTYANFETFRDTCVGYLQSIKRNPHEAISFITMNEISSRFLENLHIYKLVMLDGEVVPNLAQQTSLSYGVRESELCENIRARLSREHGVYALTHFAPFFDSQGIHHTVLIVLFQNRTGRGLYIFDNCNDRINKHSPLVPFIEFLCKEFQISRRDRFIGPQLPYRWPTARMQKRNSPPGSSSTTEACSTSSAS